jgi:hypothetical protein
MVDRWIWNRMMTKLGVYKGAGSTGLAAMPQFTGMLGRPVDLVMEFVDYTSTWANAVSACGWALGCWRGHVPNVCLSIPLTVQAGGDTLQQLTDVASGKMDAYFASMAQSCVSNGFTAPYLRPGWEGNGGWYGWCAANRPSHYIAAFQRFVTVVRKALPNCRIVFCPALYMQGIYPDQFYPGDSYVDVIGVDAYNKAQTETKSGSAQWAQVGNYPWGVNQVITFANQHGKPHAFPEWGTGNTSPPDPLKGGDDAYFMSEMVSLHQDAEFGCYWDYVAPDFNGMLSDGSKPLSAAVMINAFGSAGFQAIKGAYAAAFTSETPPVLTVTNCYAVPIQNAPKHWLVAVWQADGVPVVNASVAWAKKPINANLYDPASKTPATPVQALGQATSVSLNLTPGQLQVIAIAE